MLVAVQFALALMLLVGAGLLLQSFRRAAAVDVGFDPRGLVAVKITAPSRAYPDTYGRCGALRAHHGRNPSGAGGRGCRVHSAFSVEPGMRPEARA